jgi:protein-tyrosine-phosphatase
MINVLFNCTGNSARSILAEAILNHRGAARFRGFSAGSQPKGQVHPGALAILAEKGLPLAGLRSKSWNEFAVPGAPVMNFIFTVCGNAANEVCPIWPGHPATAHWGLDDPAAVTDIQAQRQAFADAYRIIERRVVAFVALPFASLTAEALTAELRHIGTVMP